MRSSPALPTSVSSPAPPSRMVFATAKALPVNVPPTLVTPAPTRPRVWPAVEPLLAATLSTPAPGLASLSTMALPAAFNDALRRGWALANSSNTSARVSASLRSTYSLVPSVSVTTTSLAPSETGVPVSVPPLPVPSSPRSAAAVLAPRAAIARWPRPTEVSVSTRAMPLASTAAVTVGAAVWMASNTSCSVTAPAMFTAWVLPLRSVSVKPAPGTTSTPAPLFSTCSGIVPSRPRRFTVTPSVVSRPSSPFSV